MAAVCHSVAWRPGPVIRSSDRCALGTAVTTWWLGRHRGVLALPWMRARSSNLVAQRGESVGLDGSASRLQIATGAHCRSRGEHHRELVAACVALAIAAARLRGCGERSWRRHGSGDCRRDRRAPGRGEASCGRGRRARSMTRPGSRRRCSSPSPCPSSSRLGVVLTSAEELGLAGARAWVRSGEQPCDQHRWSR